MRKFLSCLAAAVLLAAAAQAGEKAYAGPDAGYVVISMGEKPDPQSWEMQYTSFQLLYRRLDKTYDGKFVYERNLAVGNLMTLMSQAVAGRTPDYKTPGKEIEGRGTVDVVSLPAGDYEFYSIRVYSSFSIMSSSWRPKKDISVRFHVTAGAASYLGNYTAIPVSAKDFLGTTKPDGAYFLLSDESARDGEIARKKKADLPKLEPGLPELPDDAGGVLIRRTLLP